MHLEITRVLPAPTASDSQAKASTKGSGDSQGADAETAANSFLEAFQAEENRNQKPGATQVPISNGDEAPEEPSAGGEESKSETTAANGVDRKAEAEIAPGEVAVAVKESASRDSSPAFKSEDEGETPTRLSASLEDKNLHSMEAPVVSQVVEKAVSTSGASAAPPTQAALTSGRDAKPLASPPLATQPSSAVQEPTSEAPGKPDQIRDRENASAAQTTAGGQVGLTKSPGKEIGDNPRSDPQRVRDEVGAMPPDRTMASQGGSKTESTDGKSSVSDQPVEPDVARPRARPIVTLSEAAFSAQAQQVGVAQNIFSEPGLAARSKQTASTPPLSGTGLGSAFAQVTAPEPELRRAGTQPESNSSEATFASVKTRLEPASAVLNSSEPSRELQPASALASTAQQSVPSSLQREDQSRPLDLAKEPLGASTPPKKQDLLDLAPLRAEIRQIGNAGTNSPKVLTPLKQELIGHSSSPATADITAHKGDATYSRPEPNTSIGTVATTPIQRRPLATIETKPVVAPRQFPERNAGANDIDLAQRVGPENKSKLQTPGLGHSAQNAVLSMQAGLAATAIPTVPVKTDKLDMFEEMTIGVSTSSSESTASKVDIIATATQRPAATAQAVLAQLQAGMPKTPGDSTEILLSPEELGRVRMTLSGSEGVGSVLLQVERPETLDLIRRNIEQMRAELADAGWEDVSFSFSQDNSNTSDASGERKETETHPVISSQTDSTEAAGPAVSRTITSSSGLDLRL